MTNTEIRRFIDQMSSLADDVETRKKLKSFYNYLLEDIPPLEKTSNCEDVKKLVRNNNLTEAIKLYRIKTQCSVIDAFEIIKKYDRFLKQQTIHKQTQPA